MTFYDNNAYLTRMNFLRWDLPINFETKDAIPLYKKIRLNPLGPLTGGLFDADYDFETIYRQLKDQRL